MRRRLAVALLLCACAPAAEACADWLITPFLGTSLAGETTFLILEDGAGSRMTLGASVALIGGGILGLEADVAHTPKFFEGDDPRGVVLTSRVTTVSGNVLLAAPLALTRESLRPYLVGGLGLLQARATNAGGVFPLDENRLGLTLGGGAIGFLSNFTGLRFDVRYIKAVSGADGPFPRDGVSRLSFWRASAGLTIRY
jgi:opacity protein-like surface antigen